jgi:hypothetical protein
MPNCPGRPYPTRMDRQRLLTVGLAGTLVTALCCFTPILLILLGAVGLSVLVGKLDYLLVPAGLAFLGTTVYALMRREPSMIEESVITCPKCQHQATEPMPLDACVFFYECKGCGTLLRPLEGDCCVFCSYGSKPCPPIQAGDRCCPP